MLFSWVGRILFDFINVKWPDYITPTHSIFGTTKDIVSIFYHKNLSAWVVHRYDHFKFGNLSVFFIITNTKWRFIRFEFICSWQPKFKNSVNAKIDGNIARRCDNLAEQKTVPHYDDWLVRGNFSKTVRSHKDCAGKYQTKWLPICTLLLQLLSSTHTLSQR